MRSQEIEQAKFQSAHRQGFAVARHAKGCRIELQRAARDRLFAVRRGWLHSAEQRAHASLQLARAERLGDVIVRAEFEAQHAVGFFSARAQDQDRQAIEFLVPADFLAHFEAGQLGEHQIENQKIGSGFAQLRQARGTVAHRDDVEAIARKIVLHQFDDIPIVFDQ